MDDKQRKQLSLFYKNTLLEDVIPFWLKNGLDKVHGGIITSLDQDGSILDSDKSIWQQGRFAWLMAKLFNNVKRDDRWLEAASSACRFLLDHGFDHSDSRMWFHTNRSGEPIRKRRYAFSESFAAIAFGEMAKATGSSEYEEAARKAFYRFIHYDSDQSEFGPKFTGVRKTRGLGVPMITIVTAQELRESIQLESADQQISDAIETIRNYFVKEDLQCVMETVGADGEVLGHFEGRTLNPGHAIEAAWFILREADYRDDQDLVKLGCKMLDWMWERGWDNEEGGILYFVGLDGKPIQEYWHDMKFWWPHNETILATLYAYLLTGDSKYENWFRKVHDWSFDHFPDSTYGEWFGYLRKDGSVSNRLKGNLWKGPFHLPRMLYVCWKLLSEKKVSIEK